jgi:hypothetical protein
MHQHAARTIQHASACIAMQHASPSPCSMHQHAAMVQEAPLKIYARGVVSYFYFFRAPRALKIRQINSAILKVPDATLIR